VPVSSLAALALDAPHDAAHRGAAILAVIDARMGEIYAGAFRRSADGLVAPLGPESVGAAEKYILPQSTQWQEAGWGVIGSGWNAYREALAARLPTTPVFADGNRYPQARAVLRLAMPQFARGAGLAPESALPVYLRDKVALTLDEQRQR
jgi:tRNA threonylcarbamoyladenosine biosynthesis protein TsaB